MKPFSEVAKLLAPMTTREIESLAVRAGMPFATVYALARGRRKNPKASTLEALSLALSEDQPREVANG